MTRSHRRRRTRNRPRNHTRTRTCHRRRCWTRSNGQKPRRRRCWTWRRGGGWRGVKRGRRVTRGVSGEGRRVVLRSCLERVGDGGGQHRRGGKGITLDVLNTGMDGYKICIDTYPGQSASSDVSNLFHCRPIGKDQMDDSKQLIVDIQTGIIPITHEEYNQLSKPNYAIPTLYKEATKQNQWTMQYCGALGPSVLFQITQPAVQNCRSVCFRITQSTSLELRIGEPLYGIIVWDYNKYKCILMQTSEWPTQFRYQKEEQLKQLTQPNDIDDNYRKAIFNTTNWITQQPHLLNWIRMKAHANLIAWFKTSRNTHSVNGSDTCEVLVRKGDWGETTFQHTQTYGQIFAVLNMANASFAGGGVVKGHIAQEENMYRRTDCWIHAYKSDDTVYDLSTGELRYTKKKLVNGDAILDMKPRVCFVTQEQSNMIDSSYLDMSYDGQTPFLFLELKSAAVDTRKTNVSAFNIQNYKNTMERNIENQFKTLESNEQQYVVLSAYGCGAFINRYWPLSLQLSIIRLVALLYAEYVNTYKRDFKVIAFAIYDGSNYSIPSYDVFNNALHLEPAKITTGIVDILALIREIVNGLDRIENLYIKQKEVFPIATKEICVNRKKKHCYSWYIFPTTHNGHENKFQTNINNEEEARILLQLYDYNNTAYLLTSWLKIIEAVAAYPDSIPKEDKGRAYHFAEQWIKYTYSVNPEKNIPPTIYPEFERPLNTFLSEYA